MIENGPHLIYFADAMCSWCWGFAPALQTIRSKYGDALPIRLVLGGLRPGATEVMTQAAKAKTRDHWQHVQEASGQPFDFSFFEREHFVYDTDPAARAVVVMRSQFPGATLPFFQDIQRAFYALNRDVTQVETLAELAEPYGYAEADFTLRMNAEDMNRETWTDYAVSQKTGVTGFPTLIAGSGANNQYALITQGYQHAQQILDLLAGWHAQASLKD